MSLGAALATTATTLVGNKLGKGDAYEAYNYLKALLMFMSIMLSIFTFTLFTFYEDLIDLLTNVH